MWFVLASLIPITFSGPRIPIYVFHDGNSLVLNPDRRGILELTRPDGTVLKDFGVQPSLVPRSVHQVQAEEILEHILVEQYPLPPTYSRVIISLRGGVGTLILNSDGTATEYNSEYPGTRVLPVNLSEGKFLMIVRRGAVSLVGPENMAPIYLGQSKGMEPALLAALYDGQSLEHIRTQMARKDIEQDLSEIFEDIRRLGKLRVAALRRQGSQTADQEIESNFKFTPGEHAAFTAIIEKLGRDGLDALESDLSNIAHALAKRKSAPKTDVRVPIYRLFQRYSGKTAMPCGKILEAPPLTENTPPYSNWNGI